MPTAHLPTIRASKNEQVWKFLGGGGCTVRSKLKNIEHVQGGEPCTVGSMLYSDWGGGGSLYGEVQCIMVNSGDMGHEEFVS